MNGLKEDSQSKQILAKVDAPGQVKFVPAVAYHYCLKSEAFTQPGALTLANLCTLLCRWIDRMRSEWANWTPHCPSLSPQDTEIEVESPKATSF